VSDVGAPQGETQVTGFAAALTIVAMALGCAVVLGDLVMLSANLATVQRGLHCSPGTTIFIGCLATVTLAAAVLGAGVLGDRYGMKRMFVLGAAGAIVFGLLAAAAPNTMVLMIARGCVGVAFAFLSSLSLAIINAVFPPDRRAMAIARYLAAVYVLGLVPPVAGGFLVDHIGWRSGFLITPFLAAVALMITVRWVPETQRSHRKVDLPGVLVVAVALIGLIFGISQLQNGFHPTTIASIVVGILTAAVFVWWERRTDEPALDLRLFRSRRFNAAVLVGAAGNLVQGAAMIMATYHLVIIRGTPIEQFAMLLVPATLLAALAALGAGWATVQFSARAVLVAGLTVLTVSLLVRQLFDADTPIVVVAAVMALTSIGGAIVQTPQTTIMMSSAPTDLGGVVAAVKASVAGTFYSLGSAVAALLGVALFAGNSRLADAGIDARQARDALRAADAADPQLVSVAASAMMDTAHTLNVIMAVVPMAAIALAALLLRRESHEMPR